MALTHDQEEKLLQDVSAIRRAVIGEEEMGHLGLVKQVDDLQRWRRRIDLQIAKVSGILLVVAVILKYIITGKV